MSRKFLKTLILCINSSLNHFAISCKDQARSIVLVAHDLLLHDLVRVLEQGATSSRWFRITKNREVCTGLLARLIAGLLTQRIHTFIGSLSRPLTLELIGNSMIRCPSIRLFWNIVLPFFTHFGPYSAFLSSKKRRNFGKQSVFITSLKSRVARANST